VTTSSRPHRSTLIAIGILLIALGAGAMAAQLIFHSQRSQPLAAKTSASASVSSSGGTLTALSPSAIYKQASPGVVMITTQRGGFGRENSGTGSGIVLDKSGNILTNNHVVENVSQLQVTFSDGSTAAATVVSTNPSQDIATIHVSVASAALHPLTLGNSNNVLIGDSVYAIGSPFGHAESMSAGIISGLNRTDPQSGLHGLIQTDARINPGNSGGPLLNTLGQVVGINVAIESPIQGSVGVGFAIPINSVRPSEGGNL
jgi:S1-C subfamily serine protease